MPDLKTLQTALANNSLNQGYGAKVPPEWKNAPLYVDDVYEVI